LGLVVEEDLRWRGNGVTSSPPSIGLGFNFSVPLSFLILWPNFDVDPEFEIGETEGRGIVSTLVVAETSVGLEIWSRFIFLFVTIPISGNLGFEGLFRSAMVAASTFR
jgi:hypothetical protein